MPTAVQVVMFLTAVLSGLASIVLFIISLVMSSRAKAPSKVPDSVFREQLARYDRLPYNEIEDYAAELNAIRDNYSKCDPKSNKFNVPDYIYFRPFKDFKVFEIGKIYYGSLVEANEALFEKTNVERTLLAVVLYSKDEYYEKNPKELSEIARTLYAGKDNNVLKEETEYMFHLPVDVSLTNGRIVYMSTFLINSRQFPLNYVSGNLFPIIANPEESKSVFVVDSKYWTDNLLGNFVHVDNVIKRVEECVRKYANIDYCEIESFRKERDFMWDRLFAEDAVDNLCERGKEELFDGLDGNPNPKVCYGYVIAADKNWQNEKAKDCLYLPVLIVYGTDIDYIDNPDLIANDAKIWLSGINFKELLKNFNEKRAAVKLDPEATGGRLAFVTSILVSRLWLPEGKLTSMILPVVADTNAPEDVNFIPVHYWSESFIGNFKGKQT